MSSEEYKKLKHDFYRQILIILIPSLLVTFASGFIGVKVAVEVDNERIKNNKERIEINSKDINKLYEQDREIRQDLREIYRFKRKKEDYEYKKKD
jgi:uncharacterized membrane protein (DUF106 family)